MKHASATGFSLVELMMTLLVMAVLLAIGAPTFGLLTQNNRMLAENYALRTLLSAARSEAQTQRATVTVCRSADGVSCTTGNWNVGYIAFIDTDLDGILDDPDDPTGEQLLQSRLQDSQGIDISFTQASDILRFDSNGNALGSNGTFTFCDYRGASEAHGLVVSPVGAIRSATEKSGGNSPLIIDDHGGNDVSCG